MLGETAVSAEGLRAALDALSGADPTQRVFVRGDKTVPYEAVMETLDALRSAGYFKVALVGQQQ
jgi:biopolymer transport protein ExbD